MPARRDAYLLGVTGGIASGKTTACAHLRALGAPVVDADELSRALTGPNGAALPGIRAAFGDRVFLEGGALDRAALAESVFSDPARRAALEAIVHPMVTKAALEQAEAYRLRGAKVIVLNVPLLLETGMDALCDGYWVMALEPAQQIARLKKRDGLTPEQARARIEAQWPLAKKIPGAAAVIRTDRPTEETKEEISRLYAALLASISAEETYNGLGIDP